MTLKNEPRKGGGDEIWFHKEQEYDFSNIKTYLLDNLLLALGL